jgi:hypothetical protein
LTVFHLFRWHRLEKPERWIFLAAVATGMAAILNSDAFAHGRMFWMPACILAVLAVARWEHGQTKIISFPQGNMLAWFAGVAALTAGLFWALSSPPRLHRVDRQGAPSSLTAPQYLLTEWINRNLSPRDGPIGLYWLGMAYYIPEFDAADFLGKSDEMVANSIKKYGPPGHNKWQTGKTIRKWNPQVIIPVLPLPERHDFQKYLSDAQKHFSEREGFGFHHDLVLSSYVARRYKYCHALENRGIQDVWGFYVRNDLAARHVSQLTCYEPLGEHPDELL